MRALRRSLVVAATAAAMVMALLPMTAAHAVVDGDPPVVSAVGATPNPVNMPGHVHLTATVTDALSVIATAQYRVDTGTWLPMVATDGLFDELAEDVEVTFLAPGQGNFTLAVRGEDAALNTSAGVTTALQVLARPKLSVEGATVVEGTGGLTPLTFTLTPTAASTEDVSVDFAVTAGTARVGQDFQAVTPGTLNWAPGVATAKTVVVQVVGDVRDEFEESFTITLTNPANANFGVATAEGVITDDDGPPTIGVADTSIREPRTGYVIVGFTVSLSVVSGKPITVRFATANGSAKAGRDYVAKSGTLTIAAGHVTRLIKVRVLGDRVRESNQVFYLSMFGPHNAILGHSVATCVIRNAG